MTFEIRPILTAEPSRNALNNAFAALQLVIFRRPTPSISGRPRDIIVAMCILFLGSLIAHRCYLSGNVDFSIWGFQGWLAGMALWYLTITILAVLVRREANTGEFFVGASMALLVGMILTTGLYLVFQEMLTSVIGYVLFWALGLLPLIIAMVTLTMTPRRRDGWRGFVMSVAGIALTSGAASVFGQHYLFEAEYAANETVAERDWKAPDPEVIYPLQAGLLASQTDVLSAQTPGQIDIYAVLGAGTPYQQIFQREIEEMQDILSTRFGAKGQTVMLGATMQEQIARPLLNRTNLTASMRAIAERMDTAEDIGLIFLTSHGSPESLSTHFAGLTYNNMSSADVAKALDESGIQNAVIIISACYSGSFVDELAGPTRLVLTSSAADRSSFGCSDSNTFTDWGSAFFTAIKEMQSFRLAAQETQTTVNDLETARGVKPSMPQISEGRKIGVVLDQFSAEKQTLN